MMSRYLHLQKKREIDTNKRIYRQDIGKKFGIDVVVSKLSDRSRG